MKHIFGPVPSRRLGRSLGIDLVPLKTCSYDCIYCQLGRTTERTLERREWVPVNDIVAQLKERLSTWPDYITLSGSGEPTLHARIGEVIEAVRTLTNIPVALITNGSLLWQSEVRRQIEGADVVIPSLDAGDRKLFAAVNRPHPDLDFERMVDGLVTFRREYAGQYWLEIMLLAGHTANDADVRRIAAIVRRIGPDRVHINTSSRPTAEVFAAAAMPAVLHRLAKLIPGQVEVIADRVAGPYEESTAEGENEIFEMLQRRPCTIDDLVDALRVNRHEVLKHLDGLGARLLVRRRLAGGRVFFAATQLPLSTDDSDLP